MNRVRSVAAAPLFKALGDYKNILISVGCFTAMINVLMLAPSIYMLQVYDRGLSSQNETTLAMLSLMVVGFFLFIGLLEMVRSFVVIRIGSQLERRFNLQVYKAAFERNLRQGKATPGNRWATSRIFVNSSPGRRCSLSSTRRGFPSICW